MDPLGKPVTTTAGGSVSTANPTKESTNSRLSWCATTKSLNAPGYLVKQAIKRSAQQMHPRAKVRVWEQRKRRQWQGSRHPPWVLQLQLHGGRHPDQQWGVGWHHIRQPEGARSRRQPPRGGHVQAVHHCRHNGQVGVQAPACLRRDPHAARSQSAYERRAQAAHVPPLGANLCGLHVMSPGTHARWRCREQRAVGRRHSLSLRHRTCTATITMAPPPTHCDALGLISAATLGMCRNSSRVA